MALKRISLENIGPIQTADVEFGDLTVVVGPQATSKRANKPISCFT